MKMKPYYLRKISAYTIVSLCLALSLPSMVSAANLNGPAYPEIQSSSNNFYRASYDSIFLQNWLTKQNTFQTAGGTAKLIGTATAQTGTITGIVRDAKTGAPIPGATISAYTSLSTTSDDRGHYDLTLQGGKLWSLTCSASGYIDNTAGVQLDAAQNATHDFVLTPTDPNTRDYYFTWYDNVNAANWILMGNPAGSDKSRYFDLSVEGKQHDLSPFSLQGAACPGGQCLSGQVPAGQTLTSRFDDLIGGPVKVRSLSDDSAIVSQRTLWNGNSLEEVLGTDSQKLSDHFYWTWYDMGSPGMSDWVMVANPNDTPIYYEITIGNQPAGDGWNGIVQPGSNVTPTFPGKMGGPVEVRAWTDSNKGSTASVMASQRVLFDYGKAFNEVPGIPAKELSDSYLWTWYDAVGSGGKDWVLLANPSSSPVYFEVTVAGQDPGPGSKGTIDPGKNVTPTFPTKVGGPVAVKAWTDQTKSVPADIIASQRVIWGPSFEEVPGYRTSAIRSDYNWTWYDQQSAGSSNWVMVANPGDTPVYFEIILGGQPAGDGSSGVIQPGQNVTPTFPDKMGGPVEVRAWTDQTKSVPANVISSQRVLWDGHFNEVLGTALPLTTIIPDTTKVLDSTSMSHLSTVAPDGSSLTFSGTADDIAQANSLSAGDVVVISPTTANPYGMLEKVSSVNTSGDQVTVNTTPAKLEEAIQQGSIHISSGSQVTSSSLPAKTMLSNGANPATFVDLGTYDIKIDTLLDSGNPNVKGEAHITGDINVHPSFDFDCDIENFHLKSIDFNDTTTETAQLAGTVSGSVEKKIQLQPTLPLPDIGDIVPFPWWASQDLAIYVGVSGDVSLPATTSITQKVQLNAGFHYENGNLNMSQSLQNSFQSSPPSLDGSVTLKAFAGPEYQLLFYGIAGPYLGVDGFAALDADVNAKPWWKLYGGIDLDGGIHFEKLGFEDDVGIEIEVSKTLLAEADEPPSVDKVQPSGTIPATTSTNVRVDYSDNDSTPVDPNSVIVTLNGNLLSGCMATPNYVICPATVAPGQNYTIHGSVTDTMGNSSQINGSFSVSQQDDPPTVNGVQPSGPIPATNSTTVTVNYSDSDSTPVDPSSVIVILNGSQLAGCSPAADHVSCPVKVTPGQSYTIGGSVSDTADNKTSINGSFSVNSNSPAPATGRIAFSSSRDGNNQIYVMNADGTSQTNLSKNSWNDGEPVWSPDGSKIAFSSYRDGNGQIYVMNADGTSQTNLSKNSWNDGEPAWSPDGSRITFSSYHDGSSQIYVMNADGTGQTNLSNFNSGWYYDMGPDWSPDGSKIVFLNFNDYGGICVMNADGSGRLQFASTTKWDDSPAWSPDGSRIVFVDDYGGGIYVMNANGTGQSMIANSGNGFDPAWSPDGSKIAFSNNLDVIPQIYVMNADGTGQTNLSNNSWSDFEPAWSKH